MKRGPAERTRKDSSAPLVSFPLSLLTLRSRLENEGDAEKAERDSSKQLKMRI